MTIQCFGYESKYDCSLKSAFKVLYQHKTQSLEVLQKSLSIYQNSTQAESALYLAEILIEMQQFDLAKSLLGMQSKY